MSDFHVRVSPSGVSHLVFRNCATCGNGPHDDWPALPAGVETMHAGHGSGLLTCCLLTPDELPDGDAITYGKYPVTCPGRVK